MTMYPNLEAEIGRLGIKKNAIAAELEISSRALTNKLNGTSEFTYKEASKIHSIFFPNVDKDTLLATHDELSKAI